MQTRVLIIGGGATGTGLARDLALRGVHCILAEKRDINAGASGANHGLLHSGARYVFSDPATARECRDEGNLLKKLAPHCIDDCGGLFVAVKGDDEEYVADFPVLCRETGLNVRELDLKEALELEPALSPDTIAAFAVDDAAVDPFRLSLDNMAQACDLGSSLMIWQRAMEFDIRDGHIRQVKLEDVRNGRITVVEPELVVNAGGAWGREIAALAGIDLEIVYSKGTLAVTANRLTQRVINRLRPPADGDILVPGGTVSLLGTTSVRVPSPNGIRPTVEEVDRIVEEGAAMIPKLADTRYIRAYAGVRALIEDGGESDDRNASRSHLLIDHQRDAIENFFTITGGKLTTFRLMAETTADAVCERLGVSEPCRTRERALPAAPANQWSEPGLAARQWIKGHAPDDTLLCECEMLSKSRVNTILDSMASQRLRPSQLAIGQRSRVGKGSCQGSFCGFRVAFHMAEQGTLPAEEITTGVADFQRERWKGLYPICWGTHAVTAEMKEALYCGLLGLELEKTPEDPFGESATGKQALDG